MTEALTVDAVLFVFLSIDQCPAPVNSTVLIAARLTRIWDLAITKALIELQKGDVSWKVKYGVRGLLF